MHAFEIVRVDNIDGFLIYSNKQQMSVGYFHYEIKVKDRIYDKFSEWKNDLNMSLPNIQLTYPEKIKSH